MNSTPRIIRSFRSVSLGQVAWIALAVLLVSNGPIFLCTRLNGDATYYDLQVQCLQEGGVLYRDMLEPNFPGVVWIHAAVRWIGGWSESALRIFDLGILFAVTAFVVPHRHRSRAAAAWAAFAIIWFYFSLSAWSHCQRDTWMLLPALAAVWLRSFVIGRGRLVEGWPNWTLCLGEGLLWGIAFWIKPHIAIPASSVLAASLLGGGVTRRSIGGVLVVVVGGAVAGLAGSGWLIATGAWPHFWETLLEWNPEYLSSGRRWNPWPRYLGLWQSFSPWSWAHLIAVPLAAGNIFALRKLKTDAIAGWSDAERSQLFAYFLSALYLGWVTQSIVLQHPFSYVHVPGVILAIAQLAHFSWPPSWQSVPRSLVAAACVFALITSHCVSPSRLTVWRECLKHGPTLETRIAFQARPGPYWSYYPAVLEFLRSRQARDTDVLVYSSMLVPLYRDLDLRPPTRFVLTDVHRGFFFGRRAEIRETIAAAPHRFIVQDLSESGLDLAELDDIDPGTRLPRKLTSAQLARFPNTQPVVFRSGWFVVHAAEDVAGL